MRVPALALITAATLACSLAHAVRAAEEPAASTPPPAPPVIGVKDGQLTVTVRDGDLADVLRQIAEQAGFRLRTSGDLGRVTVTLEAVPLDDGLRRLTQDHELVMVYSRATPGGRETSLTEVRVFAASAAAVPPRVGSADPSSLAEIRRLLRARADPQSIARLIQLLGEAPEPSVRARAAWALGRSQAPGASEALGRAVRDPEAAVRTQAAYGLARVDGARAIPTLATLLRADPHAGVRQAAARALATLPDAAAVEALRAASADSDAGVRQEARRALQQHDAPRP
jgi:hypothetical protein